MLAGFKRKRPALSRKPLILSRGYGAGFETAAFGLCGGFGLYPRFVDQVLAALAKIETNCEQGTFKAHQTWARHKIFSANVQRSILPLG
jgi:hypothetical protein